MARQGKPDSMVNFEKVGGGGGGRQPSGKTMILLKIKTDS